LAWAPLSWLGPTPQQEMAPRAGDTSMRGKQIAWTAAIALAVVLGYDYAKARKQ
jgi:hypothetical protein